MRRALEERRQRGQALAAVANITPKFGYWIVPSQSGNEPYVVRVNQEKPSCTCQDYETTGLKCKHIFAAEFVAAGNRNSAPAELGSRRSPASRPIFKPTHPQNWTAYNAAQTHEKERFLDLLRDLCSGVDEPVKPKNGRPRLPIQDAIFAACFKVYSTVSGRRFMTDLRDAHSRGHISKVPHFNSIFNYLENPDLTPILTELITQTSLPLKAVEVDFAADSSGFATSRFIRWFDHKYGAVRQEHEWVKVHLICGVRTNIVTAVEIHGKNASDTKFLPTLVEATAKNFDIREVSADKGYSSRKNYRAIQYHGAVPYIAFKTHHSGRGGGLWSKMFHYFHLNRDEFLRHYHKRSNVESTFSMIKAKFRDHVRSKTDVAMKNEVLCKIICHNICCLIQESHELGIEPEFWMETQH